jgi:hypothetical protein
VQQFGTIYVTILDEHGAVLCFEERVTGIFGKDFLKMKSREPLTIQTQQCHARGTVEHSIAIWQFCGRHSLFVNVFSAKK